MQLYYSDILSARKACAVARYLKSPVEFRYLDLQKGEQKSPAYLALNPNGKVPTLTESGRIIWEADAVMCRLSALASSDLWPHDHRQIAVIQWFSWNAQHFTRDAGTLYFENIVKARFGIGEPHRRSVEEAQDGFRRFAAVLNSHLENRTWLVEDKLSVADFCVAVALPYAAQAQMPLQEFPAVVRWHDRLNELEAWREPFPPRTH